MRAVYFPQAIALLIFSCQPAVAFMNAGDHHACPYQKQQHSAEQRNCEKYRYEHFLGVAVGARRRSRNDDLGRGQRQAQVEKADAYRNNTPGDPLPIRARIIDIRRTAKDVPNAVSDGSE